MNSAKGSARKSSFPGKWASTRAYLLYLECKIDPSSSERALLSLHPCSLCYGADPFQLSRGISQSPSIQLLPSVNICERTEGRENMFERNGWDKETSEGSRRLIKDTAQRKLILVWYHYFWRATWQCLVKPKTCKPHDSALLSYEGSLTWRTRVHTWRRFIQKSSLQHGL